MRERFRAAIAILLALPIAAGFTALGAGCQDVSFHLASRSLDRDAGASAQAGAAGSGGGAGVAMGGTAGSGGSADAAIGGTAGSGQPVQPACSDPLTFADPDLESLLGPIHPADVAGITELDLLEENEAPDNAFSPDYYSAPPVADGLITSLVGIECLTNLEKLEMDPIYVDLEPLAQLPHLTELDFGPMQETNIPRLPQITTLGGPVPGFFVSTGDGNTGTLLRAFPSLEWLDIEGQFGPPDAGPALAALKNLTHLKVSTPFSGSAPSGTDLEPLTNLTDLSLSNGGYTDASFVSYLTDLTSLDLSFNIIQDITPISDLVQLTTLDLSRNFIRDISNIWRNSQLTSLNLNGDVVGDISALAGLTSLGTLDLGGNVIQDISPLSGLIGLTDLDLSNNLVVDLSPLVANPGIGVGDIVDVSGNQLDCTQQKQNIATLRQRGVTLSVDCP
jgi:Leucine-rich repeat (LRR) protein